jgi:hypothetical protein
MTDAPPCDGRLWMEGFEATARACLEAMPAERRARFDRLAFASPDSIEDLGHSVPPEHRERGVVYFIGLKDDRYFFVPVARAFVEDSASSAPLLLLRMAEDSFFGEGEKAP